MPVPTPLRIGVLHSYVKGSGSLDTLEDARAILNGVHLAVNDAAYRVQVFANNTACNIDAIEDTIKYMVNVLGVSAIIGPSCSDVVLKAAPLVNRLKVPAMTPAGGALAISDAGAYVYRANTAANFYLQDLMKTVAQRYPRLIAISDQTTIGSDWTTLGLQMYRRFGGTVIDSFSFDSETAKLEEIQSLVQEAMAMEPDVLFCMASSFTKDTLTAAVIMTARADDANFPIVMPNGVPFATMEQLDKNGQYPLVEGILTAGDVQYQGWDNRYWAAFGLDDLPENAGTNYVPSYNAASAIIAAAKRSGKASPSAADIQAQLTNKAFQFRSWGGRFTRFNTYGDLTQPTQVYVYDSKGSTMPFDATASA